MKQTKQVTTHEIDERENDGHELKNKIYISSKIDYMTIQYAIFLRRLRLVDFLYEAFASKELLSKGFSL